MSPEDVAFIWEAIKVVAMLGVRAFKPCCRNIAFLRRFEGLQTEPIIEKIMMILASVLKFQRCRGPEERAEELRLAAIKMMEEQPLSEKDKDQSLTAHLTSAQRQAAAADNCSCSDGCRSMPRGDCACLPSTSSRASREPRQRRQGARDKARDNRTRTLPTQRPSRAQSRAVLASSGASNEASRNTSRSERTEEDTIVQMSSPNKQRTSRAQSRAASTSSRASNEALLNRGRSAGTEEDTVLQIPPPDKQRPSRGSSAHTQGQSGRTQATRTRGRGASPSEHIAGFSEEGSNASRSQGVSGHSTPRSQGVRDHSTPRSQGVSGQSTPRSRGVSEHSTPRSQGMREHSTPRSQGVRGRSEPRTPGRTPTQPQLSNQGDSDSIFFSQQHDGVEMPFRPTHEASFG